MITWPMRLLMCASICLFAHAHASAAITFVHDVGSASFASDAAGDPGTFSIPVTSAVQAGDIVVLEVAFAGLSKAPALQVPVDSKGNAWFDIGRYVSGLGTTIQTFDLVGEISSSLQPGDVITLSFAPIGPTNPYTAIAAAQEFSGATTLLDGLAAVDGGTGSTNAFDTGKFGNLTTTNADDLIFAYVAIESSAVTGLDQTSSPPFSAASPAQGNGLTLLPLYSIESDIGSFSFAGSYAGPNAPFIVIMQALKGSATAANAVLSVGKSHLGNFRQGQKGATYSLRVANSGTAAATGTITVSDDLPAGLIVRFRKRTGMELHRERRSRDVHLDQSHRRGCFLHHQSRGGRRDECAGRGRESGVGGMRRTLRRGWKSRDGPYDDHVAVDRGRCRFDADRDVGRTPGVAVVNDGSRLSGIAKPRASTLIKGDRVRFDARLAS